MADHEPFVIGVVGAFSGPAASGGEGFRSIDRDTFDAALRSVALRVEVGLPFCRSLPLSRWVDFHPDGLCERLPSLATLVDARRSVDDPAAMRARLAEADLDLAPATQTEAAPERPRVAPGDEAGLLDSMLGDRPDGAPPPAPSTSIDPGFDRMLREIAESSDDGRDLEREDRWRDAIDAALRARVGAILADPSFRRLEATWGSLRNLVRDRGTGDGVRLAWLDLSQESLTSELARGTPPEATALGRALDAPAGSVPPVDLLVTDFAFDLGPVDEPVIDALAALGARWRVPVLSRATGTALFVEDASEADLLRWSERRAGWSWLGLCAPRLLLRAPYGADTDPVECFPFEEAAKVDDRDSYVWGSGAFALARAVARACTDEGTPVSVERYLELDGLPLHVVREDGEARVQGPSEELLTERRMEAYALMGLIPITAVRGRDAVRITSLRSAAGSPLPGL